MAFEGYPAQHKAASECAIRVQKRHFSFVKCQMALLVLVTTVSAFEWNYYPAGRVFAAIVVASILVVLAILQAVDSLRQYARTWFVCRSIAESTKSESWRFMMRADPYDDDSSSEHLLQRGMKTIVEMQEGPVPIDFLVSPVLNSDQIPDEMQKIRRGDLASRKDFYSQNRIDDQQAWYLRKAVDNQKQESRWFVAYWTLITVSILTSILVISYGSSFFNPVGPLTTATASVLSWTQARRYAELAKSYGLTSKQLGYVKEQVKNVRSESDLALLVEEAERTISREHTVWLVRRL